MFLLAVGISNLLECNQLDKLSSNSVNYWENFESKKENLLRFYANEPSLNELMRYVNLTDCLEIWSGGDSVFQIDLLQWPST